MVYKMGPTASQIIFFDVSNQYWSQVSHNRCVGPTFCPSWKSYDSQKRQSLNWKYGPQNGTNSIQDHIFRCFQLVLVPTVSNQVCWSHFLAFCEKLQVLEARESKLEIWSKKWDQQHPRSYFSIFLVHIGPNSLISGVLVPFFGLL